MVWRQRNWRENKSAFWISSKGRTSTSSCRIKNPEEGTWTWRSDKSRGCRQLMQGKSCQEKVAVGRYPDDKQLNNRPLWREVSASAWCSPYGETREAFCPERHNLQVIFKFKWVSTKKSCRPPECADEAQWEFCRILLYNQYRGYTVNND